MGQTIEKGTQHSAYNLPSRHLPNPKLPMCDWVLRNQNRKKLLKVKKLSRDSGDQGLPKKGDLDRSVPNTPKLSSEVPPPPTKGLHPRSKGKPETDYFND